MLLWAEQSINVADGFPNRDWEFGDEHEVQHAIRPDRGRRIDELKFLYPLICDFHEEPPCGSWLTSFSPP